MRRGTASEKEVRHLGMSAYDLVARPQVEALRVVVGSAERSLTLVTPYVTPSGVEVVCQAAKNRPLGNVRLLTSVTPEAVWAGACDPAAMQAFMQRWPGATVQSLPQLHAKAYVADDRLALVTSANLTGSGLHTNYEYGVLLRDQPTVRDLLSDLETYSRVGTPLGPGELARLCAVAASAGPERKRTEAPEISRIREAIQAVMLPAQVGGRSETGLFADAVHYVLRARGPLPTPLIQAAVRELHPELCDDSRELVINGRRFGKRWKHVLRNAQQHLRRRGLIEHQAGLWCLTREAGHVQWPERTGAHRRG